MTRPPANEFNPAWSSNGSQIAFISNRAPGSEGQANFLLTQAYSLYVYDLETQQTTLVAGETGADYRYPAWKPRP
jgi:Tol biopolymer transport system component